VSGFRFILDTSAVLAYDGSPTAIDVGELIAEAGTEQRMVGVPTLCLATAMRMASEPERQAHLVLLLRLENVALVPLTLPTIESCRDFANWIDDLGGRMDLAAAAMAAVGYADEESEPDSVYVISAVPDRYGDAVPVIAIRGDAR
jgi:hypothetical protein